MLLSAPVGTSSVLALDPQPSHNGLSSNAHKALGALAGDTQDSPFADIPPELRLATPMRLRDALPEAELTARLTQLATPNTHLDEAVCFLGGGTYDHYVPAIVDAVAHTVGTHLVGAHSPQPMLQTVFELQTAYAALTALDTAAAPFADGPTALVQAVRMAAHATGRNEALVTRSTNPRYRAILHTALAGSPLAIREAGYHGGTTRPDEVQRLLSDRSACLVVEHPNAFGCIEDLATLAHAAHRSGALLVVKADPIALGLLAPPGEAGADVAVADAQSLGSRPAYGSASLGLLAARADLADHLPGWRVERHGDSFRSIGLAAHAVRADRLVRPLATLAALGAEGLRRAALLSVIRAHELQRRICAIEGFDPRFRAPFFKEFVVESAIDPNDVTDELLQSNILGALPLQADYPEMDHCMLFAATECRTQTDIDMLAHALDLMADARAELEAD